MRDRILGAGLLAAAAIAGPAAAAWAVPVPPRSDGSSGSFTQYVTPSVLGGTNVATYTMYVDNGQLYACADVCTLVTTFPFRTVSYNGQKLQAFEFTDLVLRPYIKVTVVGGISALLLSQGDISVAGTFTFQNGGVGGAVSNGTTSSNGGPGGGAGGGGGGSGRGGSSGTSAPCGYPGTFTGGGGGGGGNYVSGRPGLVGFHYADYSASSPPGGAAGTNENPARLQGGGGGGAPGGGDAGGIYYAGFPGGNGGGSVLFSTPGSIAVTSTGVLDAQGGPGVYYLGEGVGTGLAGGGAGGDVWLFAGGRFTNAGRVLAHGGAGAIYADFEVKHELVCSPSPVVPGPNGGNGAGGVVRVTALSIDNSGLIDVSEGAGGTAHGGLVATAPKRITNTGQIIGRLGFPQ